MSRGRGRTVKQPAPQPERTALEVLDELLAREAAQNDAFVRGIFADLEARAAREDTIRKMEAMSAWDEEKVRLLATAKKISPEDVRVWGVVHEEVRRRQWLAAMAGQLSERLGCVVSVGGIDYGTYRSSYVSPYGKPGGPR